MNSFVEKFNIFDLFTMLIPGIIISTLFCISLSYKYYYLWEALGNEKYVVFFIFSYLCGVIFQELGTIIDSKFLDKIIYGGRPREMFLLKDSRQKFFDDDTSYKDALKVKEYFTSFFNINSNEYSSIQKKKELNLLTFEYCLNVLEIKNLTYKPDKMLVVSEMSRSLFLGCAVTVILNLYMMFRYSYFYKFYYVETVILIILSIVFLCRKIRYEKYRLRILLRTFLIYIKKP